VQSSVDLLDEADMASQLQEGANAAISQATAVDRGQELSHFRGPK
jgi:hypothetical protein